MTKWYLFSLLALNEPVISTIRAADGTYIDGIVLSVERESGSGRTFNVTMDRNGSKFVIFVRTLD